jgi:hypothetical protein
MKATQITKNLRPIVILGGVIVGILIYQKLKKQK